jgi:hypothetical protein
MRTLDTALIDIMVNIRNSTARINIQSIRFSIDHWSIPSSLESKFKIKKDPLNNYFQHPIRVPFQSIKLSRAFFQDLERTFFRFIFSRLKLMQLCGQTWMHAPHNTQNSWFIWDLPSTMLAALQGQTSTHAWHDSPLHSSLFEDISPSNGFEMVGALTGHIS